MKKFVMDKSKKVKNNGAAINQTKKNGNKPTKSRVTGAIKNG
jgi:hypothetical protein